MKTTLLFASIVSSLLFFSSCDKNHDLIKYPITGLWIGTYTQTSEESEGNALYYSYDLRADSSVIVQSLGADGNTYYGTGTWSLSGKAFSATITTMNLGQQGVVQKATATYNSSNGTLTSGVVMSVAGPFTADFSLARIN